MTVSLESIRVGDRITFKAATRHCFKKATRVVTSVPREGADWFTVKGYQGWSDFAVRPAEIIEHHPAPAST